LSPDNIDRAGPLKDNFNLLLSRLIIPEQSSAIASSVHILVIASTTKNSEAFFTSVQVWLFRRYSDYSTNCKIEEHDSISDRSRRFSFLLNRPDWLWGSRGLITTDTEGCSAELKQPQPTANLSRPYGIKVRNNWVMPQIYHTPSNYVQGEL